MKNMVPMIGIFVGVMMSMKTVADESKFVVVAHRGASEYAPENTISSFDLAWKMGADAIEGDFYLTADQQIVCIHDSNTKRTTCVDLDVKKSTLAELQKLDAGSWKGKKWTGVQLPTLEGVIETIPINKKIYIEIKMGPEILPVLFKKLNQSDLKKEQIVIISFYSEVIAAAKEQEPEIKAYWLVHFKKEKDGSWKKSPDQVLQTLEKINADGLDVGKDLLTHEIVQKIQDAGFECHVWTVDNVNEAMKFKKWGIKSVTSNVPDLMVAEQKK
jgi:glycerophosphoryl diester phosphodiesterase